MGFKAAIKISAHRILTVPSDDGANNALTAMNAGNDGIRDNVSDTSIVTEGTVSVHGGIVRIEYMEPEFVTVSLYFSKEEPGLITVTREEMINGVNLMLVFEEGVRHTCLHRHDGDAFELICRAGYVNNDLMHSGHIDLDYIVEIHGARVEKTQMHITVKKLTD